jgi:hypothetical protein
MQVFFAEVESIVPDVIQDGTILAEPEGVDDSMVEEAIQFAYKTKLAGLFHRAEKRSAPDGATIDSEEVRIAEGEAEALLNQYNTQDTAIASAQGRASIATDVEIALARKKQKKESSSRLENEEEDLSPYDFMNWRSKGF